MRNIKLFSEFINENYSTDLFESSEEVVKKWKDKDIASIKDVQTFLSEYGVKIPDGKNKTKAIKINGTLDNETITAFWIFMFGDKDIKDGQLKTIKDLAEKLKVKEDRISWIVMKKLFNTIEQRNGVKPIPPFPVPKDTIGTKDYYQFRSKDFKNRTQKTPPDYYLSYGDKYVKAFKEKTRPNLTEKGKTWLDKTLVALQKSIEDKLKVDKKIELDPVKFRKFAFDSHPDAYIKSGLFDLDAKDLYQIALTPEWRDLLTEESMAQVLQIIKRWSEEKAKEIAKLSFKVWDSVKGEFEKEVRTVANVLDKWYKSAKDVAKDVGEYTAKKMKSFINWLKECDEEERLKGYPSLNS